MNAQQHYRYDALGRRIVAMEIAGAADDSNTLITLGRRYIYDGWSVVEERTFDNSATLGNSPNTLERVYVNGRSIDEPLLAAIDGDSDEFLNTNKNTTNGVNLVDAEYYYLSNRLGSISAILDADNQDRILEYYRYEVFGSATVLPIVDNNADGLEDTPLNLNDNNAAGPALVSSFGNTYLYTARRFDDITGLYYYRNRYYDPRSGRFITRDPIGYVDYLGLYAYVRNGSTFLRDPAGLEEEDGDAQKRQDAVDCQVACMRNKLVESGGQSMLAGCFEACTAHLGFIGPRPPRSRILWWDGFNLGNLFFAHLREARNYNAENPDWWTVLPDCPCFNPDRKKDGDKSVTLNDGWASEGPSENYHPGAAECFRSYPTKENGLTLGGPGQQCCYDEDHKLITSGGSAGTPDRVGATEGEDEKGKFETDLTEAASHYNQDVGPWERLGWEVYNKFWPPNQGKDCGDCE